MVCVSQVRDPVWDVSSVVRAACWMLEHPEHAMVFSQGLCGVARKTMLTPLDLSMPADEAKRAYYDSAVVSYTSDRYKDFHGDVIGKRLSEFISPQAVAVSGFERFWNNGCSPTRLRVKNTIHTGRVAMFDILLSGQVENGKLMRTLAVKREVSLHENESDKANTRAHPLL